MYSAAFEIAILHCMIYEVGGFFKLTPEVEAGLIDTAAQRKAVGYVNDPQDRGGETKYGIAKNANPDVDIRNLDWETAKTIYYYRYWLPGRCDQMPGRVAVLHFDGCVNHGNSRAAKFLQRAVGVASDGIIGNITLGVVGVADPIMVCVGICDQRTKYYNDIVTSNPSQSKFLRGWLRRIDEMRVFTTDLNNEF